MILLRQALRGVWRNKKSYIACVVLMAVGIMVFVSYSCLCANLSAAMTGFYSEKRFADVFASARAVPFSVVDRVGELPGVAETGAATVSDARVLIPGNNRIITLRLTSFVPGEDDRLNNFLIREGKEPDDDGILISEDFAAAHNLVIGDAITLIIEGRTLTPTITGTVQNPEYVYAIPDTGQLMPDAETFSYGYMTANRLGTVTGKTGFATNISLLLEGNASFTVLEPQLRDMLAPYGLTMLVERKNHPSHAMLQQEIDSLESMATSIPMVFIFMAAVILCIMLGRLIEQERGQIGTLKAFGFTDLTILLHYMGYGGVTGLVGGTLGVSLGLILADAGTDMYMLYFSMPAIHRSPAPSLVASGLVLAIVSGLVGAFVGTRGVLKLSPSEAMRPPAPPAIHGDAAGKILFLRALLTSFGYMSVRNITRNRFRSAFVVLGVAFSFAITAFMSSYGEMFDAMVLTQFTKIQLYSTKISIKTPVPHTGAMEAAAALEGMRYAEGMLELPVELRYEHLKKNISVTAIEEDSSLYKIYDSDKDVTLPVQEGGLVISGLLADSLRVERGDILTMRTPYTGDRDIPVPVMDVFGSNMGSAAFISLEGIWKLLDIPPSVNALILDATDPNAIKDALLEASNVSAITDQSESEKIYIEMLNSYSFMMVMMQLAGAATAFAIISNTAAISLSERSREYATMRVLGMRPREIGQVVSFEYWILSAASIPFGVLTTRLLKEGMANLIDAELFSMPVSTSVSSYLAAAALCAVAVALSNFSAQRKIAKLDMVAVLKERD